MLLGVRVRLPLPTPVAILAASAKRTFAQPGNAAACGTKSAIRSAKTLEPYFCAKRRSGIPLARDFVADQTPKRLRSHHGNGPPPCWTASYRYFPHHPTPPPQQLAPIF